MNIADLENYIKSKFLVADAGIIKLICATIIANRLEGDPVWLFIIAPPSGLKTELIRALDKIEEIHHLSALTPRTLISGQKARAGEETSYLLKMGGSGIITFKDFTSILEMNESNRQEILSQLREIYDGQYSKSFGTGEDVNWNGKVGIISGVTDAIDLYQSMYNLLGERFLQYRVNQPDRLAATEKGMENTNTIREIRLELLDLFKQYIVGIGFPNEIPKISKEWEREIVELSNFATLARSAVKRDSKSRDIIAVFPAEMPIRFAKQLTMLAKALLIIDAEKEGREILRKIAFDSLSRQRITVLTTLLQDRSEVIVSGKTIDDNGGNEGEAVEEGNEKKAWTTSSVAILIDLPTTTTRRILEDLTAIGIARRGEKQGKEDTWSLKTEFEDFLKKYYPSEIKSFPKT